MLNKPQGTFIYFFKFCKHCRVVTSFLATNDSTKIYRIGADISTCTYKRNSAEFEILQFVNLFGYKYMYFYPGISTCTYIRKQIIFDIFDIRYLFSFP